jgi:hypothetical protein
LPDQTKSKTLRRREDGREGRLVEEATEVVVDADEEEEREIDDDEKAIRFVGGAHVKERGAG